MTKLSCRETCLLMKSTFQGLLSLPLKSKVCRTSSLKTKLSCKASIKKTEKPRKLWRFGQVLKRFLMKKKSKTFIRVCSCCKAWKRIGTTTFHSFKESLKLKWKRLNLKKYLNYWWCGNLRVTMKLFKVLRQQIITCLLNEFLFCIWMGSVAKKTHRCWKQISNRFQTHQDKTVLNCPNNSWKLSFQARACSWSSQTMFTLASTYLA